MNIAVVREYAERLAAGDNFPAVIAYNDGESIWLTDGWHRDAAHAKLDLAEIDVDVRAGSWRDAQLLALGANQNHGLRRSNSDKRRAVEAMLRDPE